MIQGAAIKLYHYLDRKGFNMKDFEVDIKMSPSNYHRASYMICQHTHEFASPNRYSEKLAVGPVEYINFLGIKFNFKVVMK